MKTLKLISHMLGMPVIYLLTIALMLCSSLLLVAQGCLALMFHAFHRFEFWSSGTPMLSVICDPRLKSYSQIFKESYTGEAQSYLTLYAQEEKRQEEAYHAAQTQ